MPERGKTKFVDGLVTLRATQLHQREKRYSAKPEVDEELEAKRAEARKGTPRKAMNIGRTVMPTQNDIVCYTCQFQFVMRGRAEVTQCPKCGARLSLKDEKITGGFSDELVTAGKVVLTKSAILDGGSITANHIVLEGTAKSGVLKAYRSLELVQGAVIPEAMIDTRDLRIGPGASHDFHSPMKLGDVDVAGELKADIEASGHVTVRATGHLLGRIKTAHLAVEEGAGLNAYVEARAPTRPEEETDSAAEPDVPDDTDPPNEDAPDNEAEKT